jgi:carbonic anhydrase/acetyltransferase-like protein (isoleucine patch superfamily)
MAIYSLGERRPRIDGPHWVADSATVIGSVVLQADASIWYNAVVRGDRDWITIGERSNIQDGAVLHADPGVPLTLGRGVTVGHLAMLHGCTIGDGSLIGIQATILNRAIVGRQCLIGAKSLVPEGTVVPDRSLVIGTPGKVVRALSDEEVASLARSAETYVENWKRYVRELKTL